MDRSGISSVYGERTQRTILERDRCVLETSGLHGGISALSLTLGSDSSAAGSRSQTSIHPSSWSYIRIVLQRLQGGETFCFLETVKRSIPYVQNNCNRKEDRAGNSSRDTRRVRKPRARNVEESKATMATSRPLGTEVPSPAQHEPENLRTTKTTTTTATPHGNARSASRTGPRTRTR